MNNQDIIQKEKQFYDNFALQYDEKWLTLPEWQPLLNQEIELLDKYMSTPGDLVDIGCGTGRIVIPYAQKGFRCTGIDISEPMLSVAKKRAIDKDLLVAFRLENAVETTLSSNSFDYALVVFDMLSIIPGDALRSMLLKNLHQALRPNGLLFSSVWTFPQTIDVILNEEGTLLPSRFWKTEDLLNLVQECGFKNLEMISALSPTIIAVKSAISYYLKHLSFRRIKHSDFH